MAHGDQEQGPCPNPKGMTVEFAQDVIQTRAWRLVGVGMYGSDVDVVSVDCYRDLIEELGNLRHALTNWSGSARAYEKALKEIAADEVIPDEVTLSEWAQQALDARHRELLDVNRAWSAPEREGT